MLAPRMLRIDCTCTHTQHGFTASSSSIDTYGHRVQYQPIVDCRLHDILTRQEPHQVHHVSCLAHCTQCMHSRTFTPISTPTAPHNAHIHTCAPAQAYPRLKGKEEDTRPSRRSASCTGTSGMRNSKPIVYWKGTRHEEVGFGVHGPTMGWLANVNTTRS